MHIHCADQGFKCQEELEEYMYKECIPGSTRHFCVHHTPTRINKEWRCYYCKSVVHPAFWEKIRIWARKLLDREAAQTSPPPEAIKESRWAAILEDED